MHSLHNGASGVRTSVPRAVVLWDRDCGFCAWMLAVVLRADRGRELRPLSIQSDEGARLLHDLEPEQRLASWHLVEPTGRRTSGGAALTTVLGTLPVTRPLARLTGALPAATERAYAWVATHRSLLSRPIPAAAKQRARDRIARRSASPA